MLALFAVLVALLLVFLNWYVAPIKPSEKKDLVLALAQILAGTALLSGLYFTWRTLQVNREGQITERFTRAIDQLGATDDDANKLVEIRLGGIYALERIARESKEDHWPIMEVLTAYVRQNAAPKFDAATKEISFEMRRAPDPDIQAIMTVLRRRTRSFGHGEPEPLDLNQTNLMRANLARANLARANLANAFLPGALLMEANLTGADFFAADLRSAKLLRANLTGASFATVDFTGAYLLRANLTEADLTGATFTRADLTEANLAGAYLRYADLRDADLRAAENLTQEQLEEADGDEETQLPPDLKPPTHWDLKTDEQPGEG